jgi:hypothetical protein
MLYLMLRYNGQVSSGPQAPPNQGPTGGNPHGAWISALEIVNEPNINKGIYGNDVIVCAVAQMITTIEALATFINAGGYRIPVLFAPALADVPRLGNRPPWDSWANDILSLLRDMGFRARVPMYWTHHNYDDIKSNRFDRFERLFSLLTTYPWTGRGDKRAVWLTEGGCEIDYQLGGTSERTYSPPGSQYRQDDDQVGQAKLIQSNFDKCRNHPSPQCWTTHQIHDAVGAAFQSGVFDEWNTAANMPGAIRRAGVTFRDLPGM